ncbi:hypothetical protein SAMN05216551_102151 [Chitinasiproducens palmae]|uniref:Uncharacterized protein n=2 Tax=Chitinasiproducens palmae TaxID=1770053 RepID=A0A1H2PLL6_9BURK|nr:hypothetical protein SAMN05216551_102151 [Chitinasiproducens palmae]
MWCCFPSTNIAGASASDERPANVGDHTATTANALPDTPISVAPEIRGVMRGAERLAFSDRTITETLVHRGDSLSLSACTVRPPSRLALESKRGPVTVSNGSRLEGDVSTGNGDLRMTDSSVDGAVSIKTGEARFTNCSVGGRVSIGSGDAYFKGSSVTGRVSIGSGDARLTNASVGGRVSIGAGDAYLTDSSVGGPLSIGSGDVQLTRASVDGRVSVGAGSVVAREATLGQVQVGNGSARLRGTRVAGVTSNGRIQISEGSDVAGDVRSASARTLKIESSVVRGTVIARGSKLRVGADAHLNAIALRKPAALSMSTFGGSVVIDPVINYVPSGRQERTTVHQTGCDRPPLDSASATGSDVQHVTLGARSQLQQLTFKAKSCVLSLHAGAAYHGSSDIPGLRVVVVERNASDTVEATNDSTAGAHDPD